MTVRVANTVITSVKIATVVVFNTVPVLRIDEENTMLSLPVVLGLQHATIVTGELVLPFKAAAGAAERSADVLATLTMEFPYFACLYVTPASATDAMAAAKASTAKMATHIAAI